MPALRRRSRASRPLAVAAACLIGLPLLSGCGDDDGPTNPPGNQSPHAAINSPSSDVAIPSGGSVNFNGTGSDADGTIVAFNWSFPGGDPPSSSVEDPGSVTFESTGSYVVTFNVVDNDGASDSTPDQRTITVSTARIVDVEVFDFFFQPLMVDARVGDTIRFTQRGVIPHTATSGEPGTPAEGALFDLGLESTGDVEAFTPSAAGTIPYFCRPHPFMTGSIVVAP